MSTADTAQVIRSSGLRATKPRVLIYDVLQQAGGHRTADEVAGLVGDSGRHLPRASVYNVLDDLSRVDLVLRADRGPGTAIYEKPCLDADVPGAVMDEAQIIFRGICSPCTDPT
jgi:Fe2+ or Zn2+ uptake regulation protein